MSDDVDVRAFVLDALEDLGARVSEADGLAWVQAPDSAQRALEVPAHFALIFEPNRARDFEAEFVARGSYFLDRLVGTMTARGRWDLVRFEAPRSGWVVAALAAVRLEPSTGIEPQIDRIDDEVLFLFSFRLTLLADEKRESLHFIAVSPVDGVAWSVEGPPRELPSTRGPMAHPPEGLSEAYELAADALRRLTREWIDRFRSRNLGLLEEDVRRIFGYFDKTLEEIRGSAPDGSTDLLRAVMAERDRRLTEALERFDPKARASLCAIRAITVPVARVRLRFPGGSEATVGVDAWSRIVRGLVCRDCRGTDGSWHVAQSGVLCDRCAVKPSESARPRGRPRSGTPQRGTRAGRARAQSSRGPKGRSRGASGRRRDP